MSHLSDTRDEDLVLVDDEDTVEDNMESVHGTEDTLDDAPTMDDTSNSPTCG